MKVDDIYLFIEVLVVLSVICFFLSIAAVVAALVFLFKAREKLRRLNAPPGRDPDGRLFKERL